MNLIWNPLAFRFEVQFQDFPVEQPLVKAAGFKTDGPPAWMWYSMKPEPLTKLREKKPPVLTITPEARVEYTRLKAIHDKNAEVKKQMAAATKELKKTLGPKPNEYFDEGLQVYCLRVQPGTPFVSTFVRPEPPAEKCLVCGDAIYAYEYEAVKACLYCQKKVLDNFDEVC